MKISPSTLVLFATAVAASPLELPLEKRSTPSWAGSNNYFIHGTSATEQEKYIDTLHSWGAKVVRLWVTGLYKGCIKGSEIVSEIPQLETSIGSYDDTVLRKLDAVLAQLTAKGMKAIISPHDAGMLNAGNGCDIYCNTYGSSDGFYGNNNAKAAYDARIAHILNFVSPSSGKKWSQWWEAIAAFDIQNEPMIGSVGKLQNNDPDDWICGRAGKMKNIINGSGVRIATGGIGGSEYCCDHEFNIIDKALYCKAIDMISVHGYMTEASQWAYFIPALEKKAATQGKLLYIEEWGVKSTGMFADQVAVFNNAAVPWMYWQVIPGYDETQSCSGKCCGTNNGNSYDHFEIGLTSSKGDVKKAIQSANGMTAVQDWSGIIY